MEVERNEQKTQLKKYDSYLTFKFIEE